jgi:hypothetical protein
MICFILFDLVLILWLLPFVYPYLHNLKFKIYSYLLQVLGKFHPHGDNAVYDSLVRMAQVKWNCNLFMERFTGVDLCIANQGLAV